MMMILDNVHFLEVHLTKETKEAFSLKTSETSNNRNT